MLIADELNSVRNYLELGFNKQMKRESDDYFDIKKSNYVNSLAFDSMYEGVDAGKLLSNKLNHVIDLGYVKLDGKNGRIEIMEGNRVIGVLGKYG